MLHQMVYSMHPLLLSTCIFFLMLSNFSFYVYARELQFHHLNVSWTKARHEQSNVMVCLQCHKQFHNTNEAWIKAKCCRKL